MKRKTVKKLAAGALLTGAAAFVGHEVYQDMAYRRSFAKKPHKPIDPVKRLMEKRRARSELIAMGIFPVNAPKPKLEPRPLRPAIDYDSTKEWDWLV